jgi:hypothetical protein
MSIGNIPSLAKALIRAREPTEEAANEAIKRHAAFDAEIAAEAIVLL